MKKKIEVNTTGAGILWAFFMLVGYGFAGFKSEAPFDAYAMWLTAGYLGTIGKRLWQKKKEFNCHETK